MSPPQFVVPLADLEKGPQRVAGPLEVAWLSVALEATDARPRGPGSVSVELTRQGAEVMVRGKVQAPLLMPCVRTLDPVEVDVEGEVFLLLRPLPPPAPAPARKRRRGRAGAAPIAPEGRGAAARGPRQDRPRAEAGDDRELAAEEAAADHYSGESVALDPFFREALLLELPMAPLRPDLRDQPDAASTPAPGEPAPLDPRLAPLAALRSRLASKE